jgi:multimeric flavodoxin WrbA
MSLDDIAEKKLTILGIIGSQRKLGNCELFVKEISRNIPVDHELNLIRLPSLNILPCNGCYRCIEKGTCWQKDDIPFLIDHISSCDALIVASPVYFLGTHASVKTLLDRAFSFFDAVEKMAGRPCILVNTFGIKDRMGTAPQALLTLASFLGFEVKASVNLQAALPGEILMNKKNIDVAARLAKSLFGRKDKKPNYACPFCGNDIVRMKKAGFICTLCHGSFHFDDRGKPVRDRQGWDVGNIEFVREHRQWLRGMKNKFLESRKELMRLSLPYKDLGKWIEPE